MGIIKSFILIPTIISGLWIARPSLDPPALQSERNRHADSESRSTMSPHEVVLTGSEVDRRRERLHMILAQLDGAAQIAMQMAPERAARLEPVIVDLAEQALRLANEEKIRRASADEDLRRLETTIANLLRALSRVVEPEVSL